tara:strand:+ start:2150 stop:3052 length:903 start_codon:yes stop_codon:yes gene_type:complete
MKERDIVILVLCVLGGYLILHALNHGFSFKLDLIEGIGGTCGFPETAEELNRLITKHKAHRYGLEKSYKDSDKKFRDFNKECASVTGEKACADKSPFKGYDPNSVSAWRMPSLLKGLSDIHPRNIHGAAKCNTPSNFTGGDLGEKVITCEKSGGFCFKDTCISKGCVWTPDGAQHSQQQKDGSDNDGSDFFSKQQERKSPFDTDTGSYNDGSENPDPSPVDCTRLSQRLKNACCKESLAKDGVGCRKSGAIMTLNCFQGPCKDNVLKYWNICKGPKERGNREALANLHQKCLKLDGSGGD